jgi:hypothetical protein
VSVVDTWFAWFALEKEMQASDARNSKGTGQTMVIRSVGHK